MADSGALRFEGTVAEVNEGRHVEFRLSCGDWRVAAVLATDQLDLRLEEHLGRLKRIITARFTNPYMKANQR